MTADGDLLDHIVFTANRFAMKPLSDVSADHLRDTAQFPIVVPLLLAKIAPKYLNKSFRSSITLTSGQVGEKPFPGYTVGSGFAAGLFGMTRAMALDLAPAPRQCGEPWADEYRDVGHRGGAKS